MSKPPLIWLREQQIVELVDLNDAIEALEQGLGWEGQGEAENIPKALGTWGEGSSMHALGSVFPQAGYCGWKTWVNTKGGATAVFILFSAENGQLLAVMEAAALGQMRTSAISGLATRWMAAEGADEMALIGAGKQALTQVAAVAAVRPLRRVRVFSPTEARRRAFIETARAAFDFAIEEATSVAAAVRDMPIVTTITRAESPFLSADMLARGTHLNAVGAILPSKAEVAQDIFDRADLVVGDSLPNLKRASREFIDRFEAGSDDWSRVSTLGDVIAEGKRRPDGCDLSVFKAMGMGISDLSVAVLAHQRAQAGAVGQPIDHPQRTTPRWRGMVPA